MEHSSLFGTFIPGLSNFVFFEGAYVSVMPDRQGCFFFFFMCKGSYVMSWLLTECVFAHQLASLLALCPPSAILQPLFFQHLFDLPGTG